MPFGGALRWKGGLSPWLALGGSYAAAHLVLSWNLRDDPVALRWFGNVALVLPPVLVAGAVFRWRHRWSGCQAVFWAAFGVGAATWVVGQFFWAVEEILLARLPWLEWHAVLNLCGSAAPLLALLARPHRGVRSGLASTVALDIAGLALFIAYVHAYFVVAPGLGSDGPHATTTLVLFAQIQRTLVVAALLALAVHQRDSDWGPTYQRLAAGGCVGLVGRTLASVATERGLYFTGSAYDLAWILPHFFTLWAADLAPRSLQHDEDARPIESSRPILAFLVVGLLPLGDMALRRSFPGPPAVNLFRDSATTVTTVFVLILLTARMGVERAARHRADTRRRTLAAALESTEDLILILDAKQRFEHANEAFFRLTGYTRDEVAAVPPSDLIAPESQAAYAQLGRDLHEHGLARSTLIRHRKNGTTLPVTVTVVAVRHGSGTVTHYVSVERDMTEELRTRDQLIHGERLSAVGQLASGVAHEINNPLQSVLGTCELRLAVEDRPEARADLRRILAEAQRAGRIVRNLLSFVRRSPSARTRESLNEIVQAAVELRSYELRRANITLDEQYDSSLPPITVSREEVQQVVLNLILNAEQAVRLHGGGHVSIRTRAIASDILLEIEDDGPGVPPHIVGRIFEPFFTTKPQGEGTGLGLSIAMGIAAAHQGSLVHVPGRAGACFRLTLPAGRALGSEPQASTAIQPSSSADGTRVLVVDDEPAVRELLTRLLQRRGCRVETASDGVSALEMVERGPYDVILCDARMPRMGGAEFYARLSIRHPQLSRCCVLISGDTGSGVAELAARHGVPFLNKPFTISELDAVVSAVRSAAGFESHLT